MVRYTKVLALHPNDWAMGGYAGKHGFEVRHVSIGGSIPRRLDGRESWDGIGEKVTEEGIENLMMTCRRFQPDVFLFGIHFGLTKQMVEHAKRAAGGALALMHFTDQRNGVSERVSQYGDAIDLLLLTNTDEADHAKYHAVGLKTEVLYDGVSPKEYFPTIRPAEYDAFFGGNNFAGLVREVKKKFGSVPGGMPDGTEFEGSEFREDFILSVNRACKLLVYGDYGWKDTPINPVPSVYHPNYIHVLHKAKIIINTINTHRKGLLTRRLWRSIASGRMYLTQYTEGMENYFEDGVHLAWFSTKEEGLDKLRWYLKHDEAREKVAKQGVKLIRERHTHEHRLVELGEVLRRAT